MSKRNQKQILAELTEVKAFQCRTNKQMDQYIGELKKINSKLDRISEKFDEILKWSKYASQLWDRN